MELSFVNALRFFHQIVLEFVDEFIETDNWVYEVRLGGMLEMT